MAETSSTDSPHPDELEYGSEPANEVEADSPRARGRKRRSADVNNGLVSQSTSVEPKDPAQGKRARGEEAGGKRVRKANPMFADYLSTDKKTAHTLLGQEPTNGKGRKEVLMTPAEARTKKLAKGYQYVAADEAAKPQADISQLPGKRERKKPVHADFVDDAPSAAGGAVKPAKKISVTISNPNTNPTLSTNGGRRGRTGSGSAPALSGSGGATPEPALLPDPDDKGDKGDKPAKRTKSEQSRQAKLDHTLTMLNDQLAAVTSSIRNKETVSLPPVEPEASNSALDSPQSNDHEMVEESEEGTQSIPQSPASSASYPTTPSSTRGRSKKVKSESGGRAKRAKPRPQSPPSPTIAFSASRPVRTRKVRTPSAIAGDISQSRGLVKCQEMLRELMKHEDAWPFAKPVDPVQLNIPDYFDIIKRPMDLGTVKTQLNNGHYDTVEALADDIRLVFINTRTYNKADSDIVIMARGVEELFDRRLEAIRSMGIDDLVEDGEEQQGNAKIEERIQQLSSQLKVATEEIKRLKKDRPSTSSTSTPSATPAKNFKGRPRDDNRPMSFEEKRRLSVQINNLSSEKLMKVVQIIHESNPKVAQSSAPDVIEIDIDALDTSTLRHLERVVRQSQPRQRSTSSASATSPAPNRLAQAELAASGTKERIADVKRQLDALNRSLGTKSKKNTKGTKKGGEDEDVVIDDEGVPKPRRDSDSGSSSDSSSSDSSSESDSSETSSDSDSESDQEHAVKQPQQPPPPPPSKLPTTANVPKFPFVNTGITPVAMPITTNPILPTFLQPHPTHAPLPTTPPTHDGLLMYTNDDVPEIKPSTGTKKAPEAISWNTSVLETPTTTESPATPPPVAAGATDQMWSQFQNKNILQKQKEKEREEQEELLRKEREEREEERKKEEERRKKEQEEAEVRKLRDSEAEKEQKKKDMMEQRAKAKEERERMQGKNMNEQSDMMASFERENRSLPSGTFQMSSLDLQTLGTSSPSSFTSVSSNSESSSASSTLSSESTTPLPPPSTESTPDTLPISSEPTPPPLDSQPSVTPA